MIKKMSRLNVNKPSISEFYNGTSVFITGGTGFIGKLVVEKLLRSCPGIENIYLLIRSRKNVNIKDRHLKVINSPAFDLLRENNPEALKKIILIEGDVSCLELGISKTDQELLFEKVSVIIHTAASVAMNDSLKKVVFTNLRSMRELIKLAHQMTNLKTMIHTSTAFCNLILPEIDEKIYPTEFDPHSVINLCENFSDDIVNEITPRLLRNHQNTYVFTKALAEVLISKEAKDLPIAIVRPSIIGACLSEPKVGWIDSYTAVTPFVDAISRGIFSSFYFTKDSLVDIVPADMVVNSIIAASWAAVRGNFPFYDASSIKVYNIVSFDIHPIKLKKFADFSVNIGKLYPSDMMIRYPKVRHYSSKWKYEVDQLLTHFIPAYLADLYQKLAGRNQVAVKFYTINKKIFDTVNFAVVLPYKFKSEKSAKLLDFMKYSENEEFYFDLRSLNWKTYHHIFYFGIRKFILKEKNLKSKL